MNQVGNPSDPASSVSFGSQVNNLSVSVVICTSHRPGPLTQCLERVARLDPRPSEVIVVDNTSEVNETPKIVASFRSQYIREPVLGLSRARNRGIAASSSEIIAFLDDDALPQSDWLRFLAAPFEDPVVAVVTGGISSQDASMATLEEDPARSLESSDIPWFQVAAFGGLGIGANMAIRKSACNSENVFDPRLGRGSSIGGGEESVAFVRLIAQGYRAVHVPTAVVQHEWKPIDVGQEAARAFAYWIFLFSQFPEHRSELLHFLINRLRRQPLGWYRGSAEFGPIITSKWPLRVRAVLTGIGIFLRAQKDLDA